MARIATIALLGSLICFCVFFANVALGAARKAIFLNDVNEMLMLLAASILFVIGVLGREEQAAEASPEIKQ